MVINIAFACARAQEGGLLSSTKRGEENKGAVEKALR